MEYLSDKYKDEIENLKGRRDILKKREKKLEIKYFFNSDWRKGERIDFILRKLRNEKFKVDCKINSLRDKPYDEWADNLLEKELVKEYLKTSKEEERFHLVYDHILNLRDKHFRFSKSYKNLDGLAKTFCKELNEYIFRLNALCFKLDFGTNLDRMKIKNAS